MGSQHVMSLFFHSGRSRVLFHSLSHLSSLLLAFSIQADIIFCFTDKNSASRRKEWLRQLLKPGVGSKLTSGPKIPLCPHGLQGWPGWHPPDSGGHPGSDPSLGSGRERFLGTCCFPCDLPPLLPLTSQSPCSPDIPLSFVF